MEKIQYDVLLYEESISIYSISTSQSNSKFIDYKQLLTQNCFRRFNLQPFQCQGPQGFPLPLCPHLLPRTSWKILGCR